MTVTFSAAARRSTSGAETGLRSLQHLVVGVAQVDGQGGAVRHDVDEIRTDLEPADRGDLGVPELQRQASSEGRDLGRDVPGVAAQAHRRRAGVSGPAVDRQLGPGDALHALDDADADSLVFEDRSLLDVQLDEGVWRDRSRARHGPGVSDAGQFIAEASTVVDSRDVEGLLERHAADEHEAPEHVRCEAGAFLVREEGDDERPGRRHPVLLQRLDHLQPGEDTEIPVEATAGGDRVDVRSGHHRSRSRIGAGTGGDDVSEGVDRRPRVRGHASS